MIFGLQHVLLQRGRQRAPQEVLLAGDAAEVG